MADLTIAGNTYLGVPAVDFVKSGGGNARYYEPSEILYAGSATSGGTALSTEAIPYGAVDSTSTSTAFTATINGISELKDGTCMLLKNGVVNSSSSGFTININGLGAKPVYTSVRTSTTETCIFYTGYTLLFVYDTTRVSGGCWLCCHDANACALYFTGVAVSATTGDIATISDGRITPQHVVVKCVFENSSYIPTTVTWTTSKGSCVLNGTCSSATTVSVVLDKAINL